MNMRLGISCQFEHASPEEWGRKHKEAGLGAVVFPLDWTADVKKIDEYVLAAKENDLVIAEVGIWNNPLDPDSVKRKENRIRCVRQLELAEYIGAKCCVNITGAKGEMWDGSYKENYDQKTFDEIVLYMQEILDEVKPVRAKYTLETMPHALPDSPESYLDFIKAINRPSLGVHMDIVNMLISPRVYYNNRMLIKNTFDLLGDKILSCHVKDATLDHDLTVSIRETEPGTGGVDLEYYIEQAEKYDIDMPMIIEHLESMDQYLRAIEYMKGLKGSKG